MTLSTPNLDREIDEWASWLMSAFDSDPDPRTCLDEQINKAHRRNAIGDDVTRDLRRRFGLSDE